MGQAKSKGSFAQRQALAIANARAKFPASVKCNNCANDLTEITPLDVRGMLGLRLAGAAICDKCSDTTYVLDGTPEALQNVQEFMRQRHGEDAKAGFEKKPG